MPRVSLAYYSIQYDGTNGAHIAGVWCTGISFVSDTGAVFTYEAYDGSHEMGLGDWMLVLTPTSVSPQTFTNAEYAGLYYELP